MKLSSISLGHSIESQDHATDCVPASERRSPLTLGLLWITMVTGFPTVFAGFEWYKAGLGFDQICLSLMLSLLIMLAYSIPACLLGAISGQTFTLLSRGVFGRHGSWIVSLSYVVIGLGWYGLDAMFLTDGLKGLYSIPVASAIIAFIFGLLMSFNNLFGFSGIANFAKYLAAPLLILWVGLTFFKSAGACPHEVFLRHSSVPMGQALAMVSAFFIGYASWGNEPDYWRYSKPNKFLIVIPLTVSLAIGQIFFPLTGWMMASLFGNQDYAQATALMNSYAFGGISIIAAIVLTVTLFAVNDSGLYGMINAVENVRAMPRKYVVCALALVGAVCASLLTTMPNAFELVASASCGILPAVTIIMIAEHGIVRRIIGTQSDFSKVISEEDAGSFRWTAMASLFLSWTVWLVTSGFIPALKSLHVGVPTLTVWLTALISHVIFGLSSHAVSQWRDRIELAPVEDDSAYIKVPVRDLARRP